MAAGRRVRHGGSACARGGSRRDGGVDGSSRSRPSPHKFSSSARPVPDRAAASTRCGPSPRRPSIDGASADSGTTCADAVRRREPKGGHGGARASFLVPKSLGGKGKTGILSDLESKEAPPGGRAWGYERIGPLAKGKVIPYPLPSRV